MVIALVFGSFSFATTAFASNESASFDLSVTSQSPLSQDSFSPVGVEFSYDVTSPDAEIDPVKEARFTFPEFRFDANPETPVCPDNQVGPPPVNLSAPIDQVVARCPDSVVGNGSATFLVARNNLNPGLRLSGQLVVFNGGEVNGNLLLKVYAYSYETAVGLYAPVTYQDQTLSLQIPYITNDSAVVSAELGLPGRDRLVFLPTLGTEVTVPGGTVGGVDVLAKCPASSLNLNGELTLGRRDGSGQPIGEERGLAGSKILSCTGLPGGGEGPTRNLTVQVSGGGSVTTAPQGIDGCRARCERSFAEGQRVTLTATPDQGAEFLGWGNACSGMETTCSLRLWSAKEVEASFAPLPPSPPAGPVGVSINRGSQFTNDPRVAISLVWPFGNRSVLLSNDGGFQTAQDFELQPSIPWTLDSSGPERLPKTVYVRFDTSNQTFSDDIILDETSPTVSSASAQFSGGRTLLRVTATDPVSGVASIQAGPKRSPNLKRIPYRSKISIPGRASKIWLRVNDRAGNSSKWTVRSVKRR